METIRDFNLQGIKPTHSEIATKINLSRPTLRKRLRRLIQLGQVRETLIGRKKCLELTRLRQGPW